MKIDKVKVPIADINYKAIVNDEPPIAKVKNINWGQLKEKE